MTLLTELHPAIAVRRFCSVFGKSRQALYHRIQQGSQQDMQDSIVVKLVAHLREDQPRLGTRKLQFLLAPQLAAHDIKMGRDQLFNLLERYGMLVRHRRRRAITTNSNHPYYKYGNLVKDLVLTGKNQLWVSDITYIQVKENFGYVSLITDAFSRKITGYCLWHNLSAQGPVRALNQALQQERPARAALIHHSDRGVQYCCGDYTQILQANGLQISMSDKGDPYQNAIAERINGILKAEYGLGKCFGSLQEAQAQLDKAVAVYNSKRPHDSLSYLTPDQAHQLTGIIKRNWKNYSPYAGMQKQDYQTR